jgi:beta-aspartyl-dipeptidase (metallo-type)
MIDAGVDVSQITFTSDGQGSMPVFDARGQLQRLDVGRVTSLWGEVRDAVFHEQIPIETALRVVTSNPARILKLRGKGQLVAGNDADVVLLDPRSLEVRGVIARGHWLMRDGEVVVKGTFES